MRTFKDQVGLGLFKIPFYDKTAFGHSGGIDGFTSVFGHFPDDHISYAQTSNGSNTNTNNISITVLSAIFGKPYEIPDFRVFEVNPEDLDQYAGVYSSKQLPIKITVTRENTRLIAQGTGQSSFPLEATAKDQFKFEQAGIIMEFNPAEKTMILKQGGGTFTFIKE